MNSIIKTLLLLAAISVLAFMGDRALRAYRQIQLSGALRNAPELILSQMTLEEKVGQIIHVGMDGQSAGPDVIQKIGEQFAGGVILFARNLGDKENTLKLNRSLQEMAKKAGIPPLFISIDQEGGRVVRVKEGTVQFPGAMATGQADDPELTEDAAFITGYEMRKLGFNLILAPVLDVNNNPLNPVINTRSYGSDPDRVTRIGTAHARGIRKSLSTPVIKHFPGHGNTEKDSHLALPAISRSMEELEAVELVPFRAALRDGAEAVMSAHILFPSLDETYPATLSEKILQQILRKRMGFEGIIMTDAMEMHAIAHNYSAKEAPRLAFRAGADIILLTGQPGLSKVMYDSLLEGFRSGELSEEMLNRSVKRQITLKLQKGLYQENDFPIPFQEVLGPYFASLFEKVDGDYEQIQAKYGSGEDLNRTLTRLAIRSLRKGFPGLEEKDLPAARVFYRSNALREQAKEMGIPEKMVHPVKIKFIKRKIWEGEGLKLKSEARALFDQSYFSTPGIVLVEFGSSDLAFWNTLATQAEQKKGITLVGLYTGNPFFTSLAVPSEGALLASFSYTDESSRALLFRAFHGPVLQADLIMP